MLEKEMNLWTGEKILFLSQLFLRDATILDIFLWEHVKEKVCLTSFSYLIQLKQGLSFTMRRVYSNISRNGLKKAKNGQPTLLETTAMI